MTYVLFILYALAGWWLLSKCRWITQSGLNRKEWSILYLLKISAGVAIGWLSAYYYPQGSDYWMIHRESLINYEMLRNEPGTFFKELFTSPYGHFGGYFDSVGSYWTDLKNNLVIKTEAIINMFSGGNYYVNSIFFNLPGFIAHVALYKMFRRFYPGHHYSLILGAFLLPSALYFSSGIHKDAFLFMGVAGMMYACISHDTTISRRRWLLIFLSFILIALVRSYVLASLIPALVAYRFSMRYPKTRTYIFVYSLVLVGALAAHWFTAFSPATVITQKQQAFLNLPEAQSQISIDTLDGSARSVLHALPTAAVNIGTQPRFWEESLPSTLIVPGLEWYVYLLVITFGIIWYRQSRLPIQPLISCLLFVIPLLLLIGFIVPNSGSIIRYRALYLPYLITPFLAVLGSRFKHIRLKYM